MNTGPTGRRDVTLPASSPGKRERRIRRGLLALGSVMILTSVLGLTPYSAPAPDEPSWPKPVEPVSEILSVTSSSPVASGYAIRTELPLPPARALKDDAPTRGMTQSATAHESWQTLTVGSGDSLARLFQKAGIPAAQVLAILDSGTEARRLTRLHPGDILHYQTDTKKRITRLRYAIDDSQELLIQRDADGLSARLVELPVETRQHLASGEIRSSLYHAALDAGLSDNLIMELANIFGWDIDFALDIRQGDRFTVLYETRYKEGEKIRDGHILAAEFINRGKRYRAVRYSDGNYYSPDGHSMRKAFLRSPVDFRRISSRFRKERYHPVLGRKRPHRGVDYAAARGTPIKASGDGKIIFRGWKGGYGRAIILQHGSKYTTLYAHMSKFRQGLKRGSRVKQGQVIGYVGQSGLATGPHLHYEFRINGVHRNPLTVKLPQARPIARKYQDDFKRYVMPMLARLDVYQRSLLALNTPP